MVGAKLLGIRGRMLIGIVVALWLFGSGGARADLPLPHTDSANVNAPLLRLTNTNTGSSAFGFWGKGTYGFVGESSVIGGAGARGSFIDDSGSPRASGNLGRSVTSGSNTLYYGVWGKHFAGSGAAVYGVNEATSGNVAVFELTNTNSRQNALMVTTKGTSGGGGFSFRDSDAAVFTVDNPASAGEAVEAVTNGTGNAVEAVNFGTGRAGRFETTNASNLSNALEVRSSGGDALYALHTGLNDAGRFEVSNSSSGGEAVDARHNGSSDSNVIQAIHTGLGRAGWFEINNPNSHRTCLTVRTDGQGHAGFFYSTGLNGGMCLYAVSESNIAYPTIKAVKRGSAGQAGEFGIANTTNASSAMHAWTDGPGLACNCSGDSLVDGDLDVRDGLTPSAAALKIDHPLDPANRYLQLPAVHSSEMTNLFKGVTVLDQNGEALVELPEWFEAANSEFTYHLTPIGAPGPGMYVAQEIQNNVFQIAGGSAGLKVSWMVTGVRQDPYALQNPIAVEADKPADEIGRYRHPEAYGLPEQYRLEYEEHAGEYRADSTDEAGVGEMIGSSVPEED